MAVLRDASKSVDMVAAGSRSTSFTVTTNGKGRVLFAFQSTRLTDPLTTATYGGQTMTEHYSATFGVVTYYILILLDPPTGTNTYTANNVALNYASGVVLVSYTGANTGSIAELLGSEDNHNDSDGTLGPFNYSAQAAQLVLCAVFYSSGSSSGGSGITGFTQTGQASIGNTNGAASAITRGGSGYVYGDVAVSETPGDTTVAQGATFDGDGSVQSWTFSINPLVEFQTRAVEYSVDAFDPDQTILDSTGVPVERWDIRANEWIRVTGLEFPDSRHYDTFFEDPTLAYIEAVQYDGDTDTVSITTNRGELPEVILARVAAGGTG